MYCLIKFDIRRSHRCARYLVVSLKIWLANYWKLNYQCFTFCHANFSNSDVFENFISRHHSFHLFSQHCFLFCQSNSKSQCSILFWKQMSYHKVENSHGVLVTLVFFVVEAATLKVCAHTAYFLTIVFSCRRNIGYGSTNTLLPFCYLMIDLSLQNE